MVERLWGMIGLRLGGEGWREGWKRWEDIGPCLRGEEDAQRFEYIFNEMSFKKQTVCRAKHLRVACTAQT
ncbi:hypothetical protein Hanom_Chr09g00768421 [Helianthus anomalus]